MKTELYLENTQMMYRPRLCSTILHHIVLKAVPINKTVTRENMFMSL